NRTFAAIGGIVMARQGRLVIEGVDVARRAVHEQKNAVFRPGGEMCRPWGERMTGLLGVSTFKKTIARTDIEQRQGRKAGAEGAEPVAAGELIHWAALL